MPPTILLVNDDGFMSRALPLTYEALSEVGSVVAVVPEIPKSGGGHSLTLHKPIFVRELEIHGFLVKIINGTPVDAIHVARSILGVRPDLVVSGVNIGENTSAQNILYSGTVEAAIEAGLFGYPAIAFSADVSTDEEFMDPAYSRLVRKVVMAASRYVLEEGWFDGVDTVSINIPKTPKPAGAVMVPAQRIRFYQRYERRVDPRGREYYWLVGDRVLEEGKDSDYLTRGYVTITPLISNLTHPALLGCPNLPKKLEDFVTYLDEVVKRVSGR